MRWAPTAGLMVSGALLTAVSMPVHADHAPQMLWTGRAMGWAYDGMLASPGGHGVVYAIGRTVFIQHGQDWQEVFHLPVGDAIQAVMFTSRRVGFLYVRRLGPGGTNIQYVYQSVDGGKSWRVVHRTTATVNEPWNAQFVRGKLGLAAVTSLGWSNAPVVGPAGMLVSQHGVHWSPLRAVPKQLGVAGVAAQGRRWWLAGTESEHGVLGYVADGIWHPVLRSRVPLSDVTFSGRNGIAVGGQGSFLSSHSASARTYVTHDGGRQWTLASYQHHVAASFSQLFPVSARVAYAGAGQVTPGANGPGFQALYLTQDGGIHWHEVLDGSFSSFLVTGAQTADAAAANGVVWQTRNAGRSWQEISPALLQVTWVDAPATVSGPVFMAVNTGFSSLLMDSSNNGGRWSVLRSLGTDTPIGWFSPSSGVVETGSGALESLRGNRVTRIPLPGTGIPAAADFTSLQSGWVVMSGSSAGSTPLYATTDAGKHWRSISFPLAGGASLIAVRGSEVALVGFNGQTAISRDNGRHWVVRQLAPSGDILAAAALDGQGRLWVFGNNLNGQNFVWREQNGRVVRTTAGGSAQSVSFGSDSAWLANGNMRLYRSTKSGAVWHYRPIRLAAPLVMTPP
jgi:photosystem II stability/assembly factor-like uncharacterized protein